MPPEATVKSQLVPPLRAMSGSAAVGFCVDVHGPHYHQRPCRYSWSRLPPEALLMSKGCEELVLTGCGMRESWPHPTPGHHSRAVPDWRKLWEGVAAFRKVGLASHLGSTVKLFLDVGIAGELAPSS